MLHHLSVPFFPSFSVDVFLSQFCVALSCTSAPDFGCVDWTVSPFGSGNKQLHIHRVFFIKKKYLFTFFIFSKKKKNKLVSACSFFFLFVDVKEPFLILIFLIFSVFELLNVAPNTSRTRSFVFVLRVHRIELQLVRRVV